MLDGDEIERLIAATALDDRGAFNALYTATSAKLFGVVLRVLNNRNAAEETLQDVYIKIWHNAGRYQVNGLSPMTWLITIARNTAIDARRRKTREADGDLHEMLADSAPGPENRMSEGSGHARLSACFAELEPDRAGAVRRAYLDGKSYAELAAQYGVPLNTMRSWLRRSLLNLWECLGR